MARRFIGATILVALNVVAGCADDNIQSAPSLEAVIDQDQTGASVVLRGGGDWEGPPPDVADVEAAYTTLVACLTEAGLSGTLRFDLSISTALIQNVSLGRTEAEARDGQQRLESCLEPFDTTISAYMITNPPSDAERDGIRRRLLACADLYFPGELADEFSYDDTIVGYEQLLATSTVQDPRECGDEAKAGPKRAFGSS